MSVRSSQRIEDSVADSRPAAFFDAAYAAYQRAEQAAGGATDAWYEIAGFPIRLRSAGDALAARLTPALAHLTAPAAEPALTICLWDTVSTGAPMPKPPWGEEDFLARAEIRGYNTPRFRAAYDVRGGALRLLDQARNLAIFWTHDPATLPVYDRSAPFRMILHWWMQAHQRHFVHAGAVGTAEGGVLLAGKREAGESTAATVSLLAGLLYAGDDYCLVSTEPAPCVYSLYSSAKLDLDNLRRCAPRLEALISNPDELGREKALLFFHPHYPTQMAREFPVRAILLPTATGGRETRLIPAAPITALQALAPGTLAQLSGAGAEEFRAISAFVRSVPSYHLELGAETNQIPRVIAQLLNEGQR